MDGSVLAEVQGGAQDILQFSRELAATRAGNGIRDVQQVSITPLTNEKGFVIL
jgi:hypothetical protein